MPAHHEVFFQSTENSPLGNITLAGLLKENTGIQGPEMRILGNYALVYLLSGHGRFKDARNVQRDLVPGDLLLLFPEIGHLYGPPRGQVWNEFYIVFSGPVFDLWRRQGLLDPDNPLIHLEPIEYWLRRFREVIAPDTVPLQQIGTLQHVLTDALTIPASQRVPPWVTRAKAWLDENPTLSLSTLARRLSMSYESFRKQFNHFAGMPPARYRTTRIINRACQLVASGKLTNKEIARQTGFCDEFHFSRRFRQMTGFSPTQFRRVLPMQSREKNPARIRSSKR